jgi:hypothetical protein
VQQRRDLGVARDAAADKQMAKRPQREAPLRARAAVEESRVHAEPLTPASSTAVSPWQLLRL